MLLLEFISFVIVTTCLYVNDVIFYSIKQLYVRVTVMHQCIVQKTSIVCFLQ